MKLAEQEEYREDYYEMAGLWDDIKSGFKSVVSKVYEAVKPSTPEIIYRLTTPVREALPKEPVTITPSISKPVIPTWLIYGGLGLLGFLILTKISKKEMEKV
jgi:hypothetical protein